jgi:three-Cys-motif partner protein
MNHKFGGIWTRKKLEILTKYLSFYSTALKKQKFALHYADAFAGTGKHTVMDEHDEELLIPFEDFKGSVLTALEVEPGFHQYHFNDIDPLHVQELEKIRDEYSGRDIRITEQDANQFVPEFCARLTGRDRAVLLLDPYSTQLDWETLGYIADSGKVDLWLLFPLSVILRMTPRDGAKVRPEWSETLNRLLGTDEWENVLYAPRAKPQIEDMFGGGSSDPEMERLNTDELQRWVTARLRERFPFVAEPILLTNRGRPLFSFYFAVANPEPQAWALASKVVSHILQNTK